MVWDTNEKQICRLWKYHELDALIHLQNPACPEVSVFNKWYLFTFLTNAAWLSRKRRPLSLLRAQLIASSCSHACTCFHSSGKKRHKISLNVLSWAIEELDTVIRPSLRGPALCRLTSERDTSTYWSNPLQTNQGVQPAGVSLAVPVPPAALARGHRQRLQKWIPLLEGQRLI